MTHTTLQAFTTPGRIHAASPDRSDRLRRVLELLQDGSEHSTLDVVVRAKVCAVNSCMAELRACGHAIDCRRSGDVWLYRLAVVA